MTENTMAQFNQEGRPAFPEVNEGNDNPSESPTENTNGDQTPSSEENKNQTDTTKKENDTEQDFHKHPRWVEREDDWKKRFNEQEDRHTKELADIRKDLEEKLAGHKPNTSTQVPDWFGGDEDAWNAYQADLDKRISAVKDAAKKEALGEIQSKSEAEKKAIDEATTYFNDQVSTIESDKTINPNGTKVDRNKLLKFVLDNELVDTKGRWNYRAGWIMMNGQATQTKADTTKERKEIAGATTSDKGGEQKPPSYTTSADFAKPGNRPW